jgi:hypothetical protein
MSEEIKQAIKTKKQLKNEAIKKLNSKDVKK